MPELPEVETIKRDLEGTVLGRKILGVAINNPAVIRQPGPTQFAAGLRNAVIKRILRRAKVLILELSNGKALTVHLKMTGQLVYPGNGKTSRVSFRLSGNNTLDFNDQRLFAELRLLDDWRELKFIKELGPEPFDLTIRSFKKLLSGRKTRIKPLLMDQTFIAGIGNLYAAEILFRAKINPERSAVSLAEAEKTLLFKEIVAVLDEAIKCGGSSIDDYVRVSGKRGDYSRKHKVYGRQGKPCMACKTVIKKIAMGGRGTCFCPRCQK
ncbi:MAG: bifunctional DNA-formamidopyrimidine glycosylase/DNA-(apurinic or apyrimidinic site) lyase [Candidatus Omnitrophica bacterium]|jgi:formamidopyrimidine-DNA glycosylase|nr:bifunctional DNA-formamidopyrimidine glycosylase/DNA-(apurinic or apyrimidinic site) lyase [Candidatus Omnitrophota bacterium]MDD5080000.1 bifunctional DNA-formamidopyrimidine glycosylase/DNA-(apurinic or apyrimidinic site) lyase [Candidatus Omnitrophota bacterium]